MERREIALIAIALIAVGLLATKGAEAAVVALRRPEGKLEEWEELIQKYATIFNVPSSLIKAIIMVESSGKAFVSRKENGYYSYGLMGVTLPTARDMGFSGNPSQLFDPEINIYYGVKYLRWLMDRSYIDNNIERIAAGYNAGPDLTPWPSKYIEKVKYWIKKFEGG